MLHSRIRGRSHPAEQSRLPRGPNSAWKWRSLSSIAVLLATLLSSAPSFADGGTVYLSNVVPEAITVNSNGSSYTSIAGSGLGNIVGTAHIELDADIAGRVKRWSVCLGLSNWPTRLSLDQ